MFSWLSLFGRHQRRAATAPAQSARPAIEELESRTVPALVSRVGTSAQASPAPYAAPPWAPLNARQFVTAEAPALLQAMYFNNPATYQAYVQNFHGVLARWVASADRHHLRTDAALTTYLQGQLAAEFQTTRDVLAEMYPKQSTETYELLLAMNLVTGFYQYATAPLIHRSLYAQLHLHIGDCAQIAQLLESVIHIEGFPAQQLAQYYNFTTPLGPFMASHDVVYAGGLWLDAEVNTAFAFNLQGLEKIAPYDRLPSLVNHHHVFGFYNWYLQPQVRASQLAVGLDGGILSFYYQYYLAGIGQGATQIAFES